MPERPTSSELPQLDPFERTISDAGPRNLVFGRACARCRHYKCVCMVMSEHREGCEYRTSVTLPVAVECERHKLEGCEICHPCTCADLPKDESMSDLDDDPNEISVVMNSPIKHPTPEMINDPVFGAILSVIKDWDIGVPDAYRGYISGQGEHARLIFEAVMSATDPNYTKTE